MSSLHVSEDYYLLCLPQAYLIAVDWLLLYEHGDIYIYACLVDGVRLVGLY